MARYVLDFGSNNGGKTPPAFAWFRDAATHAPLTPPQVYQSGSPAWTYYFDLSFPLSGSQGTRSVEYGITLNGISLTDVVSQPGYTPTRFYLDFGSSNGGLAPAFSWFRDAVTKAAITAPVLTPNASPAWNYYFDAVFPSGTNAIEYGATLNGTSLSEVAVAPLATSGLGGAMTLAALRTMIRQESDTENDPHISDSELTSWINQSRFAWYDKLITAFGEDYYVAKATIFTDGLSQTYGLPDGTLYGGAPAFYKGMLLEAVSGPNIAPNAPVTLRKFNLREKNRFVGPVTVAVSLNLLPRYRAVGSNIEFDRLPQGGLTLRLWYAPRLAPMVADTDIADDFSGWLEMVVVDCAIKVLAKQERDAGLFVARKNEILAQIDTAAANRDLGEPNTVTMTEDFGGGGGWYGGGGWLLG